MEDRRRRRHLAPNDDDDDLVELPAADKPRHPLRRELSRTSRFFISTAQRETHGGFLHRTSLPPTLQGFFSSTFADENVDEPDADEPPPPPPTEAADEAVLPLQRYGHFAHLLSTSAAPLVDVDPTFSFLTTSLPAADYVHLIHSCNGLLLFGHVEDFLNNLNTLETSFIVCNPATKEWVQVASCYAIDALRLPKGSAILHAYLLFEPAVSSHFHIVMFVAVSRGEQSSRLRRWRRPTRRRRRSG